MEIEVIVQSILPSDGPQGRYRIKLSSEATIDTLINMICAEANVPIKQSYCLRHAANKRLAGEATLNICNVRNGEVVHWTDEDVTVKKGLRFNVWWFLSILSLLIGCIGLIAVSVVKGVSEQTVFDYGIVMDAGSSHTSLYVYKWDGAKYKQTAVASQFGDTCRLPGKGLSSFNTNPEGVVEGLKHCLDFAKTVIPDNHWAKSPVYLGATAGMRLLNEVNASQSDAILTEVRKTIKIYPFLFANPVNQARIITGDEEGTFSWITSNYISRSFNVDPPAVSSSSSSSSASLSKTIGALDMGGASAQISFVPNNFTSQPVNYTASIRLYGENYTLYTHSFLCYGVNQAIKRLQAALVKAQNFSSVVNDPCAPKDSVVNSTHSKVFKAPCSSINNNIMDAYSFNMEEHEDAVVNQTIQFIGQSDTEGCKTFVEENLFNFTETCKYPRCSFNGQYQPSVFGDFYAFSTFYYVTNFLNLTDGTKQFTLEELKMATRLFCNKTLEEVKVIPVKQQQQAASLLSYCFQANFVIAMLTKGYKFNDNNWKSLRFVAKVEHTDIGWALGFMLNESNQIPAEFKDIPLGNVTFTLLIILFAFFISAAIGFVYHAKTFSQTKRKGYTLFSGYGAV